MSISNIENIQDHFKIPIFYNKKKREVNENIITDLELIETIDASSNSIYQFTFEPSTNFGKKVLEQFTKYYTTDKVYLKDTQTLLKTFSKENEIFQPDTEYIIKIWDEIKNDNGFKEKYQYIDWSFWEFLNKSETFLHLMSIYNLSSPLLSFIVPVIILIVPFFIIKCKGLNVTIGEYIEVLKLVSSNHAIGRLFTQFSSVKFEEKIYLSISAAFYLFSIYQNILTFVRFHENMKKIHIYLQDFKQYIIYTENSVNYFLSKTTELESYKEFNNKLIENTTVLSEIKERLEKITEYKGFTIKKTMEYGFILKLFYDLYQDPLYNSAFLYSFGFNGYIDNIVGLTENIKNKHIRFSKFTKERKTAKKKNSGFFKNFYYPSLLGKNPVTNNINFEKNLSITGPNASGKTTILKSTLINILLTQQIGCGFYEEASLEPFDFIHCYLNIPDTSGRDSLFQAEARRCKNIIDIIQENPKERHFCVFDELYSGTNPEEAVMSATAFMNYLSKYKKVKCMLTTHFFELCKHLEKNSFFENYHMKTKIKEGSENKRKKYSEFIYTYELEKGISKTKGGVKVLNDMNYPNEIIENANQYNSFS
jgi:hypothetical protein